MGIEYLSPVRSLLLASPVLLALLACHPSPQPTPGEPVVEPKPEPDSGKPVKSDEVTLSPTQTEVSVPVGTKLLYSFSQWASVGLWAEQKVADETVVRYVRTDEAYAQSEADRARPGGDSATGTFVFEAAAPGSTTVQIDESDKGTVTKTTTFMITVTAP